MISISIINIMKLWFISYPFLLNVSFVKNNELKKLSTSMNRYEKIIIKRYLVLEYIFEYIDIVKKNNIY